MSACGVAIIGCIGRDVVCINSQGWQHWAYGLWPLSWSGRVGSKQVVCCPQFRPMVECQSNACVNQPAYDGAGSATIKINTEVKFLFSQSVNIVYVRCDGFQVEITDSPERIRWIARSGRADRSCGTGVCNNSDIGIRVLVLESFDYWYAYENIAKSAPWKYANSFDFFGICIWFFIHGKYLVLTVGVRAYVFMCQWWDEYQ